MHSLYIKIVTAQQQQQKRTLVLLHVHFLRDYHYFLRLINSMYESNKS